MQQWQQGRIDTRGAVCDDDAVRQAGVLEFDYVSTVRRRSGMSGGGGVSCSTHERAMSARRFKHMLLALGLGEESGWASAEESDFDRVIDESLEEVEHLVR